MQPKLENLLAFVNSRYYPQKAQKVHHDRCNSKEDGHCLFELSVVERKPTEHSQAW